MHLAFNHHHLPIGEYLHRIYTNRYIFQFLGLFDAEMYIEQEKMGQKCRGFFGTCGQNRGAVCPYIRLTFKSEALISGIFNIVKAQKISGPQLFGSYIREVLISDDHIQGQYCNNFIRSEDNDKVMNYLNILVTELYQL